MSITIRLAVRDWDYFMPLALGEVTSPKFTLDLHRVESLPDDLADDDRFDAGEMSFSRYTLSRSKDCTDIVGIPHFIMRAFRHRCIITTQDSPYTEIKQLKGKRIGLTGWQDSGNTWTKALLRREGIDIADVKWSISRLMDNHTKLTDRADGYTNLSYLNVINNDEKSLISMLKNGELDAIFTAFMPDGFFSPDSGLRQLIPDFKQAEIDYYHQVGYVPGIHMLGIKPEIVERYPWIIAALSSLLDESVKLWQKKREKYAETTPWIIDDLRLMARILSPNWNLSGFEANRKMIAEFAQEQFDQKLNNRLLTPEQIFPYFK